MKHSPRRKILASVALVVLSLLKPSASAEPSDEVRRAFINLHDDMVKHNCGDALGWLYARREQLKDDLVDELYRTDAQGASAIMFLLLNVRSFKPDERFLNAVVSGLAENDRYSVPGRFLCDYPSAEPGRIGSTWAYVDAHFDIFEPRLTQLIGTTGDPWILWAIAWEYKSRKMLEQKIALFTPEVMRKAAANLADDNVGYNASQTVRLFLLLGDRTVPILKEAAQSSDAQARNVARATLDALKGSHRAFGYLNAHLNIVYQLLGLPGAQRPAEYPPWLNDETEPYAHNEKPYP